MDYQATVTQAAGGIDIIAHRDELGREPISGSRRLHPENSGDGRCDRAIVEIVSVSLDELLRH